MTDRVELTTRKSSRKVRKYGENIIYIYIYNIISVIKRNILTECSPRFSREKGVMRTGSGRRRLLRLLRPETGTKMAAR